MANLQKCAQGTEAANDALNAIVDKALVYPKIGVHIGKGPHVPMPPSWDGQGALPPGWTRHIVANYVASAATSALPIPDDLAALLQGPPAQANLTGAEKGILTAAINGMAMVDLDVGGYAPKAASAARAQLETAKESKP